MKSFVEFITESHVQELSYEAGKSHGKRLDDENRAHSEILRKFPKGPMGLVPDNIRLSPEYQSAKRAYDHSFKALQRHNQWFVNRYKKEYAADRAALLSLKVQKTG